MANLCYFSVVLCVFYFLGYCWCETVTCDLCMQLGFLGCRFSSSTFYRDRSVDMYCLNLVLSWNTLFSPLTVTESFADYSSLGLHPDHDNSYK